MNLFPFGFAVYCGRYLQVQGKLLGKCIKLNLVSPLAPKKRPSGRGHIQAVGERRKRVEESRRQGFQHYVNLTVLTRFNNDSKFLAIATRRLHIYIVLKKLMFFYYYLQLFRLTTCGMDNPDIIGT